MRELIASEDKALMRLLAMLWIGGDPDDPDDEDQPKPGPPKPNLR